MNISIIVGGRFHAFNLAEQLNKNGYLSQIITSYPKFYLKKNFGINQNKIESIILKEIVQRSLLKKIYNFDDMLIEYFDNKAKKLINLENLDILIGWSGFSLKSFELAKKEKCIKILERGSTHIEHQLNILKEEYEINNLQPILPSDYVVKKEKKEYEIADYITVPTDFAKDTFLSKGFPEKKIIKIPYGVDLTQFRNNKYIKRDAKFRIIYTGSISIRKGVIYLLKAFSELNLENSELLLIGNIESDIEPLIKKFRVSKNIIFKKSIKQLELSKYYSISDLFITCSIEEGLSMVQLQAMSCKLPVICTQNSGGNEIIDNGINGFILPIRNVDILKSKILFLYENKSICSRMGLEAERKVKSYFSWESYGKNVISTYRKLLK